MMRFRADVAINKARVVLKDGTSFTIIFRQSTEFFEGLGRVVEFIGFDEYVRAKVTASITLPSATYYIPITLVVST